MCCSHTCTFFLSWWCMQLFLFVTVMYTALSVHQSRQNVSKKLLNEILTAREPPHCPSDGLLVDHLDSNTVRWECILFNTNSALSTYKLLLLSLCRSSYHIYLNAEDFSLNLVPKYVGLFKIVYEVPNQITSNQTMRSPIKASITKSCRQSREQSISKVNWSSLLFLDVAHLIFFKETHRFWSRASVSSGREAPNLMDPIDWAVLSYWAP